MKIKGMRKITRMILCDLYEEIEDKYEDFYKTFGCSKYHKGGRIFLSPDTEEEALDIKNFIEKKLNIKLKAELDKDIQQVTFVWRMLKCNITLMNPHQCDLIDTEEITDEEIIEEEEEIYDVVKTVTRQFNKVTTMKKYRCSGGKEYTVETEKMVEVE